MAHNSEQDKKFSAGLRVLLIPFHFPPIQGSTGASRSFEFARWLPEHGWKVTVLSVRARAYPGTSDDIDYLLPAETRVIRAFALDAKRHLSIGGRYLRLTALPDRWSTWIISGIFNGLVQIWKNRPDVIYTTYPTPSSHTIGMVLHKLTGIPWIAEFRDPMVEEGYPEDRVERRLRVRLEKAIFRSASRIVTVTPSAQAYYQQRAKRGDGFAVEIANGYSDSLTDAISEADSATSRDQSAPRTILHSGFLYEDVRSPRALMLALRDLATEGKLDAANIRFVFRGAGNEVTYAQEAADLGLANLVEFRESVSYTKAYQELAQADALLLMQGERCNRQIPAKFYEYCALQKPVLCLADPNGDTGQLFESLGLGRSVALEDSAAIRDHVPDFLASLQAEDGNVLHPSEVSGMSRRARAKELAAVLDEVVSENRTA